MGSNRHRRDGREGWVVSAVQKRRSLTQLDRRDPRDERKNELIEIGDFRRAKSIDYCGRGPLNIRCGRRECPVCSQRKAQSRTPVARSGILRMTMPMIWLAKVWSKTLGDCEAAVRALKKAFAKLKRRACFKGIVGGMIAVEVALTERCWLAHAHVVLDGVFDLNAVQACWAQLIGVSSGSFEPDPDQAPLSIQEWASYMTKAKGWCPDPGTMPTPMLDVLFSAIRGKRLFGRWGTAKEPKKMRR
jgi:hypothetical protein